MTKELDKIEAALRICLGHLTCGMDGDWSGNDPAAEARYGLDALETFRKDHVIIARDDVPDAIPYTPAHRIKF